MDQLKSHVVESYDVDDAAETVALNVPSYSNGTSVCVPASLNGLALVTNGNGIRNGISTPPTSYDSPALELTTHSGPKATVPITFATSQTNGTEPSSPARTPVKSGSFFPLANSAASNSNGTSTIPIYSSSTVSSSTPTRVVATASPVTTLNGSIRGYLVEKFHIHEFMQTPLPTDERLPHSETEDVDHPFFAGKRDVMNPQGLHEMKIVSSKGTVRGFKNRVKAGIATFLEHQHGIRRVSRWLC